MYRSITWYFCSEASQKKIQKIQYHSLKLLSNDYDSEYQLLLKKTPKKLYNVDKEYTQPCT